MAFDPDDGNLYGSDSERETIDVFDQTGKLLRILPRAPNLIPVSLEIDSSGKHLYVSEEEVSSRAGHVIELDQRGRVLSGPGSFPDATSAGGGDVGLSPTGDRVYAVNIQEHTVRSYTASGTLIHSVNVPQAGQLTVETPSGVVAVTAKNGTAINLFSANLKLLRQVTSQTMRGAGAIFYEPLLDDLYAINYRDTIGQQRVTVFSSSGRPTSLLPHDFFADSPPDIQSATIVP